MDPATRRKQGTQNTVWRVLGTFIFLRLYFYLIGIVNIKNISWNFFSKTTWWHYEANISDVFPPSIPLWRHCWCLCVATTALATWLPLTAWLLSAPVFSCVVADVLHLFFSGKIHPSGRTNGVMRERFTRNHSRLRLCHFSTAITQTQANKLKIKALHPLDFFSIFKVALWV